MKPQTWEHFEMMINEEPVSERLRAVAWLESQPLIPPARIGEYASSTVARRPMFEVLPDHGGNFLNGGCLFCARSLAEGHEIIDLGVS